MKCIRVDPSAGFHALAQTRRSQAGTLVLKPGESTGGEDNRHPDSDQWLFVLSGTGEAIVGGETVSLSDGSLLLVEAGESHEVRNTGTEPLRTLDFYAPPAF